MLPIYERYRPRSWAELIGQEHIIRQLDSLRRINGSLAGGAFWIVGPSGMGKTTIARLIAAEVSEPFYVTECNAAEVDLPFVRVLEDQARFRPLSGQTWCYIINEAHKLRDAIVTRLLTTLEESGVQRTTTIIFTTTRSGAELFEGATDSAPFASRCVELSLSGQGMAPKIAKRLRQIAQELGVDGKPESAYLRFVNDRKGNIRLCLEDLAKGAMSE